MDTKAHKLRLLLGRAPVPAPEPARSVSQEVYRRKLAADIARTINFIRQADDAIERLQKQLGPWPAVFNESAARTSEGPALPGPPWGLETCRQAHLLAHFEVYKQMPYQPMKNDLIGIATGLTLTLDAVVQQAAAAETLRRQNEATTAQIAHLAAVLSDYKRANTLVLERVREHPRRTAEMQRRIARVSSFGAEAADKLAHVQRLSDGATALEDRLHAHLLDVVTRLYAMMDWENAHVMDEDTFTKSIAGSVLLVKRLVSSVAEGTDKWVTVRPGTAEERLMEVMIRNDLLLHRDDRGDLEVRLRDYGL
ncbi:hypothetical protein METBIDRAFT_78446 [Metschnikowia bicuspidata var. bicuspidata NRRL YB-4993]|uniref:Uncharacterized protein n=1 Tax=Metschnikowia bicuspidata var. bicuspidata NRRL YB-4993 TaxID=869754 RepID=A0A1A0HBH6_9ASCO|nr:hypothetical protein METBIDRAFT_78446 [Metschnikowia bicuspidata var. bicuspidata NRRL YB-4993]OBA21489.1 hypothetical protein METBIDRAFT_78446 [Metschnikowia bicuspidata var. bicuspidata NRRL YB-4993]